jgi:Tryptophan-associated transmembrane protein (Trp_oprn_chp)
METAPRLDASRPSNLRLIAFALTAIGALVMGIGSVLTWVTVGFADAITLQTASPGTDLGAGLITLVCAVVVLVLIIVSRLVSSRARRVIAVVVIAAAAVSTALAAWFALSAADHYSPVQDETLVNELAQATGKTAEQMRSALAQVVDQLGGYTHVGIGPWVAVLGGLAAIAGGILTLRWANRISEPAELPPH